MRRVRRAQELVRPPSILDEVGFTEQRFGESWPHERVEEFEARAEAACDTARCLVREVAHLRYVLAAAEEQAKRAARMAHAGQTPPPPTPGHRDRGHVTGPRTGPISSGNFDLGGWPSSRPSSVYLVCTAPSQTVYVVDDRGERLLQFPLETIRAFARASSVLATSEGSEGVPGLS